MHATYYILGLAGLLGSVSAQAKPAPWSIATAANGDVTVTLDKALADRWTFDANLACNPVVVQGRDLSRRDLASCALDYSRRAANSFTSDGWSLSNAPALPAIAANDVAAIAAQGVQLAMYPQVLYPVATLALFGLRDYTTANKIVPIAIKILASDQASPTASACPPLKTKEPSVRICEDGDGCKGDDKDLCQVGTYKGCSCVHAIGLTRHANWFDINLQNQVLADLQRESDNTPQFNSETPQCNQGGLTMDPAVMTKLTDKFCLNANITRSTSGFYGGGQLTPPATISGNRELMLEFYDYSPQFECSVQQCQEQLAKIITTCQFNSHTFSGFGSVTSTCGTFRAEVINKHQKYECSGTTEEGVAECRTDCGKPAAICGQRLSRQPHQCQCN